MFTKPSAKTEASSARSAALVGITTIIVWITSLSSASKSPTEMRVGAASSALVSVEIIAYFVPAKSGKYVDATPVPDDYEPKH